VNPKNTGMILIHFVTLFQEPSAAMKQREAEKKIWNKKERKNTIAIK
jgi:hypothetical protein